MGGWYVPLVGSPAPLLWAFSLALPLFSAPPMSVGSSGSVSLICGVCPLGSSLVHPSPSLSPILSLPSYLPALQVLMLPLWTASTTASLCVAPSLLSWA